jgi:hypothetical protein
MFVSYAQAMPQRESKREGRKIVFFGKKLRIHCMPRANDKKQLMNSKTCKYVWHETQPDQLQQIPTSHILLLTSSEMKPKPFLCWIRASAELVSVKRLVLVFSFIFRFVN